MQKKNLYLLALILTVASGMTAQAETVEVPQEVVEISEQLGGQYNICPELIQAICWRESRFTEDAQADGCVGIMQVNERYHKDRMARLGVTDIMDMQQNMTVAVDYLAELSEGGTDIAEVLMTFHGEANVQEKLENGKISSYAEEIMELSAELEHKKEEKGNERERKRGTGASDREHDKGRDGSCGG